jgi:hypothetical protein
MIRRLPQRRKRERMGVREPDRIVCPAHGKYIRSLDCLCKDHARFRCEGRIEAHHQVTRGAGGGDEQLVPLCAFHHALLDSPGWSQKRLEEECRWDFAEVAARLWQASPAGRKYRNDRRAA